jgi:capsular polysaccharide biosynthesis protein
VEIDEVVARVVRRYWPLLLIMTVLPVLFVGATLRDQAPSYTAATRLNASDNPDDALGGDSGVSAVVSQVKAYATSQDLLAGVIREQGVDRRPADTAAKVEVTGLGSSTVVELTISDHDPDVARKLTGALGTQVVQQLNEAKTASLDTQLKKIDSQISGLNKQLSSASQRVIDNPLSVSASNTKERLLGEISDLRADRNDLRNQLATAGRAKVVQQAVVTAKEQGWTVRGLVAGLVGLVGGILISVLIETFRPTVPGPQRVAKRLGVPLLGHANKGPARLSDMGRRIRLAAKREGVAQVTLVSTGSGPLPASLVSTVAAAVYGDSSKIVNAQPPRPAGPDAADGTGLPDDVPGDDGGRPAASHDGRAPRPPVPPGTSIVRSGAALMTKRTGEIASVPEQTAQRAAAERSPLRATHVHAFEDMDPGTDTEIVGVVAVAGPVTRLAALEAVRDLVTASGWPLLGVIATSRRIRG